MDDEGKYKKQGIACPEWEVELRMKPCGENINHVHALVGVHGFARRKRICHLELLMKWIWAILVKNMWW